MTLPLTTAKRRLAQAWFAGAGVVASLLLVLTLFGDQDSVRNLWEAWFVPGVMPNLSLIVGVLVADFRGSKAGDEEADTFVFKLAFWLSCIYLGLMLVTLLASPLTAVAFEADLENSRYFLAPLQALATAALGAFYVRRETKG